MASSNIEASQRVYARVAGFMYLFALPTSGFGVFYLRPKLIVPGDAAATAGNFIANEQLFRIAIISDLLAFSSIVLLALAFFVLLKPISKHLALLALSCWLGESFILGMTVLNSFFVLLVLDDANYLTAFEPNQLQALATLFLKGYSSGYSIGLIFFGLGSIIYSYLLFRSRYIPRLLAAWGIIASILVLLGIFVIILDPEYGAKNFLWVFAPIFLYELIAGFWLLLMGANVPGRTAA